MEFGGLTCRGTESSLLQCTISGSFVRTWSKLFFSNQDDYAGVRCIRRSASKYVAVPHCEYTVYMCMVASCYILYIAVLCQSLLH